MDAENKTDEASTVLPKRKYQKRKTESKISVRHYLNMNSEIYRPDGKYGKYAYPVYVQVIYRGKTYRFRTFLSLYSTKENFEKLKQDFKSELEAEATFFKEQISFSFIHTDEPFSNEVAGWNMTDIVETINKKIIDTSDDIYFLIESNLEALIKANPDNSHYKDKLYDMQTVYYALTSLIGDKLRVFDMEAFILACEVVFFEKEDIKKLKEEFVTEPNLIEFLFEKTYLHTTKNTVVGWRSGLTQMYIRSCYRGTENEQLCETYIARVDNLLVETKISNTKEF